MSTISNILITVIIFGMIITGTIIFWGDMNQKYGITTDVSGNISNTMNAINSTMVTVNQMNDYAQGKNSSTLPTTSITWFDQTQQFIFNFFNSIKLVWNMGGVIYSIMQDLTILLGFPVWFTNGFIAIIIIVILAAIYYAITGRLF